MAIYHCSAKSIGRSAGRSATAAAAYRAGKKIEDKRLGLMHDYSRKRDVDHAEVMAPDGAPEWARNRSQLWNEVESTEKRRDAQLARELVVALPRELSRVEKLILVSTFAKTAFSERGIVADLTVHGVSSGNPHAHIMLTTREIGPEGFGRKNRGWGRKETLREWRSEWARHANAALERSGRVARIDHRSLEAQGIGREPGVHLGPRVAAMERRGAGTARGRQWREIQEREAERAEAKVQRPEPEAVDREPAAVHRQESGWERHYLAEKRRYLAVPYAEKDAAKEAGARWDREAKSWYAPEGGDLGKLSAWDLVDGKPPGVKLVTPQAREEFGIACRECGLVIEGDPMMDGKWHWVPVKYEQGGETRGVYRAYADGEPSGTIMNLRYAETVEWAATVRSEDVRPSSAKEVEAGLERAVEEVQRPKPEAADRREQAGASHRGAVPEPEKKTGGREPARVEKVDRWIAAARRSGERSRFWQRMVNRTMGLDRPEVAADPMVRLVRGISGWLGATAKVGCERWVERRSQERRERVAREKVYWEGRAAEGAKAATVPDAVSPGHLELGRGGREDKQSPPSPRPDVRPVLDHGTEQKREQQEAVCARAVDPKKELRGDRTDLAGPIIVAEKATAKILHKATGRPVAYPPRRSSDLEPVVEALRGKYPEAKIIVAAACDGRHGTVKPGTLRRHAEMERGFGCEVVTPRFTEAEASRGMTDFRDLARSCGKEWVRAALDPDIRRLEREDRERQERRAEQVRQERETAEKELRMVEGEETKRAGENVSSPAPGDAAKAERDARITKEFEKMDPAALDEALQIREAEKILQERARAREKERPFTKEKGRGRDTGMEM